MKQVPFWRLVGLIFLVGAVANIVVWFGPRDGTGTTTNDYPTYPPTLVAEGEAIFRSNCARCHGTEAQGSPAAGTPALDGTMHAWHHSDSQIAGFVRGGVGRMPAVGATWSDEEIRALLAYLKQPWSPEQRVYQAEASRNDP